MIEIRRMRLAAGGLRLIRGERGVAVDQANPLEREQQFFRHQLLLRGRDSLAQFLFAAESGNGAVGTDRDPGICLAIVGRPGDSTAAELSIEVPAKRKPNHQRTRRLEKPTPIQHHQSFPSHFATAFA